MVELVFHVVSGDCLVLLVKRVLSTVMKMPLKLILINTDGDGDVGGADRGVVGVPIDMSKS